MCSIRSEVVIHYFITEALFGLIVIAVGLNRFVLSANNGKAAVSCEIVQMCNSKPSWHFFTARALCAKMFAYYINID
jgi:hypothetical protein